jgi:predicted DNA-binding transcriptional regulator AlpA
MRRMMLSRKEAADRLGVSVGWLETLHRQGAGPAYYKPSPRMVIYDQEDLDRWLESTKVVPGAEAKKKT